MFEVLVALLVFSMAISAVLFTLNKTWSVEQSLCWQTQALSLAEAASHALTEGETQFINQWQKTVAGSLPNGVGKISAGQDSMTIEISWLDGTKQLKTAVFKPTGSV